MTPSWILCLGLLVIGVLTTTLAQDYEDDAGAEIDDATEDIYIDTPVHRCECVPFYLCGDDNKIITNGENIIDVRARLGGPPVYDVSDDECPVDDENNPMKCCDIPPEPNPEEPNSEEPKSITSESREEMVDRRCGTKGGSSMVNVPGWVRIQAGSDLGFGEIPWMLALMKYTDIDGELSLKCGASLIHPQVALTGAHCVVNDPDVNNYVVRAGEYDLSGDVEALPHQERSVIDIKIPNNFNKGALYHDYALLHLDKPMTLSDHIDIICLPEKFDSFNGQGCMASGWGQDAFEGKPNSLLRKVDLAVVEPKKCQNDLRKSRLGRRFILDPSFVCAQGMNNADTCKGDGGSPLVCPLPSDPTRWVQVGITAWGIGCGSTLPAVYANVPMGRDWIDEQLLNWGHSINDQPEDVDELDNTIQDVFNNNIE